MVCSRWEQPQLYGQTHHCRPGDCTEQDLLGVEQENPVKVVCSIVLCYSPSIVTKLIWLPRETSTCGAASENNTFRMHLYF